MSSMVTQMPFDIRQDSNEYHDPAAEHPDLAEALPKEIRDGRALYPISRARSRLVLPPGWCAPKDRASYPIPFEKLQEPPAPGASCLSHLGRTERAARTEGAWRFLSESASESAAGAARSRVRRTIRRAGIALLVVLGTFACYRPQVVAGPSLTRRLAGVSEESWPAIAGIRLHVFNTGMNRVSKLLVGTPAPWRPAPAFVIEHPSRGLVIFDCGLGPEIARQAEGALHPITRWLFQTRSLRGADLPAQMREVGLSPLSVRTVVLSHLHFDHVGGADAFENAHFVVGRGQREAAGSRMNGFEPVHSDWISENRWQEIDFPPASAYATFDASFDLFGDASMVLVRGGGHTPGGIGVLIALPGGPVLLAGDLVVHFDWLEGDDVQRIVSDAARAAEVRNRVRLLRELLPRLVVIPGHDLSRLPRGRSDIALHHPERFAASAWPIPAPDPAGAKR